MVEPPEGEAGYSRVNFSVSGQAEIVDNRGKSWVAQTFVAPGFAFVHGRSNNASSPFGEIFLFDESKKALRPSAEPPTKTDVRGPAELTGCAGVRTAS
jgi:hypothetical protein